MSKEIFDSKHRQGFQYFPLSPSLSLWLVIFFEDVDTVILIMPPQERLAEETQSICPSDAFAAAGYGRPRGRCIE